MMRKYIVILFSVILMLSSCSQQKSVARRFVKNNRKTVVALYLPERLEKRNLRNDSIPAELSEESLQTQIEYLEKQIKVIDKVNDDKFLDIIYLTMKETLKDYGLTVDYWGDSIAQPDSTHWLIDIPKIEITEVCEPQRFCDWIYENRYCLDVPVDLVNVAIWFDISNDTTSTMTFTEQNYFNDTEVVFDLDYQNSRIVTKTYCDTINIDGFYRFAAILGRLYAGYCYDFMMNKFIDNQKVAPIDPTYRLRYDPYERYFYKTDRDYLIEVK